MSATAGCSLAVRAAGGLPGYASPQQQQQRYNQLQPDLQAGPPPDSTGAASPFFSTVGFLQPRREELQQVGKHDQSVPAIPSGSFLFS